MVCRVLVNDVPPTVERTHFAADPAESNRTTSPAPLTGVPSTGLRCALCPASTKAARCSGVHASAILFDLSDLARRSASTLSVG